MNNAMPFPPRPLRKSSGARAGSRALMLAAALVLAGCATQSAKISAERGTRIGASGTSHFFVAGILQTDRIEADVICRGTDSVGWVESGYSAVNVVIGILTFGLYVPRDYEVLCTR